MVFADDFRFHRRRAEQEVAAASSAKIPTARRAHLDLACRHEVAAYEGSRDVPRDTALLTAATLRLGMRPLAGLDDGLGAVVPKKHS